MQQANRGMASPKAILIDEGAEPYVPKAPTQATIKLTSQRPKELEKRQGFDIFPTEWIPYGSLYWLDFMIKKEIKKKGEHQHQCCRPIQSTRTIPNWQERCSFHSGNWVSTTGMERVYNYHLPTVVKSNNQNWKDKKIYRVNMRKIFINLNIIVKFELRFNLSK